MLGRHNKSSKQIQNQLAHTKKITRDYMGNKLQRYKAQSVLRKPERLLTSKFIILVLPTSYYSIQQPSAHPSPTVKRAVCSH